MPTGYDFLILGAGIFGITTAIELRKRNYHVGVLNPETVPHPLAASTDISKAVRMEYGSDLEYMDMAIASMEIWREWNQLFNETLFHEVGYVLLTPAPLEDPKHAYEQNCYVNLRRKGFTPERLNPTVIRERFPAFNHHLLVDGLSHALGGYVESAKAVKVLLKYARQIGVEVHEGQTAERFILHGLSQEGVKTREGRIFQSGHTVVCAGNFTPYLIPELKAFFKITGHPVFHIKPSKPDLFKPENLGVFGVDISNTGWYGFPQHPSKHVVKVANHGVGLELHPEQDLRVLTKQDFEDLKAFLLRSIPSLAQDPVVYTRRCCYTDTLDGHFWIDRHPSVQGLSIGSGGSGHGFKMGPVLGKMIADMAENGSHQWSDRYDWRVLDEHTFQQEEARNIPRI